MILLFQLLRILKALAILYCLYLSLKSVINMLLFLLTNSLNEKLENTHDLAKSYQFLGSVQFDMGEYDLAEKNLKKSVLLWEKVGNLSFHFWLLIKAPAVTIADRNISLRNK